VSTDITFDRRKANARRSMLTFFNSNIVLYSVGCVSDKTERNDAPLAGGNWVSVQELSDSGNATRRKMRYIWPRTRALLDKLTALVEVVDLTQAVQGTESAAAIAGPIAGVHGYDLAALAWVEAETDA